MLSHTEVAEIACNLCRVEMLWAKISSRVDFNATSLVPSSHPVCKSKMDIVPRLLAEKVICTKHLSDSGYKEMMQP